MFMLETARNTLVNLDSWLVLLGALSVYATAILAKWRTSDTVKGVLTLVITATIALVKKGLDDGDLTWAVFLNGWVQTVIPAMLSFWFLPGPVVKLNEATGNVGILPNGGPFADVPPAVPTPPPPADLPGE